MQRLSEKHMVPERLSECLSGKTEGPGDVFQENTWSQNIFRGICMKHLGASFKQKQKAPGRPLEMSFGTAEGPGDIFQETIWSQNILRDVFQGNEVALA